MRNGSGGPGTPSCGAQQGWCSAPGWCLRCSPNAEEGRSAEGPAAEEAGSPGRPAAKSQPGHRSYNLHERRRIGSMTGVEQAQYQKMPTDESEAQTLASADLDYMKSEWGLRLAGEGLWGARSCAGCCKAGAVHGASGAGAGRAGLGAGSGRRGCRAPSTGRSSASGAQPGAGTQGGWSRRRRRCLPRGLSGLQLRDFQGCFCHNSSLGASLPSAHPQPVGKGCRAAAARCWPPRCAGACQHTAPIPPGRVPPPAPVAPRSCGGRCPAAAAVPELAGGLLLGKGSPWLRGAGGS